MSIPIGRFALAVATSLVIAAGTTTLAMGPAGSWATSQAANGGFLNISLVIDRDGVQHIAADSPAGITYLEDRGGTWHRTLVLANRDGAPPSVADSGGHGTWGMPSIALDDQGRVYIAAVYGALDSVPGASSGIWLISDKGRARGTFGTPRQLAGKRATEPALKVTGGHIGLAYGTYGRMGPGHQPVWFGTDASGSWTRTRVALDGSSPSLRMDDDGHARIAFVGRHAIRYARATTRTGGFVVSSVAGSTGRRGDPSLALDAQGRPRIAWSASGHVWYSAWSSGRWASPSAVPAQDHVYRTELILDTADRPHLVLATEDLAHVWRDGTGWHREIVAAGADPLEVAIRASSTGLKIAWTGGGVWVGHR